MGDGPTLKDAGVEAVLTPPQAPDCNAFAERFIRTIKEECLSRMIVFGESSLHRAVGQFVEHYHRARPHQGLDNVVIERGNRGSASATEVLCDERLGGLLRHYRHAA